MRDRVRERGCVWLVVSVNERKNTVAGIYLNELGATVLVTNCGGVPGCPVV